MEIIQRGGLKFEIQDWRPKVTFEMGDWLLDNGIQYNVDKDKYGPGDGHYFFYIWFETEEDAMAFKLRWT